MLEGWTREAPLVVDSGNALFRAETGSADEAARQRASLILSAMGRLGTRVMAVGARDLTAGPEFLAAEAKKAGVSVLSCNLSRSGKAVFEGSALLTVQGLKVAFVGVTGPMSQGSPTAPAALVATAVVPAVAAELAKLPVHDVTIVLAATSYADSLQLATELGKKIDFVLQSGESRGGQPPQRVGAGAYVLSSGQKGQLLGHLALEVGGPGPWVDLELTGREKQQLDFLDGQLRTLEERLEKATDVAARKDLGGSMTEMRQRRAEQQRAVDAATRPGARTLKLEWKALDPSVKDDPALKAEVLKVEPTYAGSH